MTTVTYRDGIVAFDSFLVFNENTIIGTCDDKAKKIKMNNGEECIVGASGNAGACEALYNWAEKSFDPSKRSNFVLEDEDTELSAFIVKEDGSILQVDSDFNPYKVIAPFVAVGSGYEIALGAMEQGASAMEALKIAAKYNVFTGGKIRQLSLAQPKKKKGNK